MRKKSQNKTHLGMFIDNPKDFRKKEVHGKTNVTFISYCMMMLKIQNQYNISQKDMSSLLKFIISLFGTIPTILPSRVEDIEEATKDLLINHEEYLVCQCGETQFREKNGEICSICDKKSEEGVKFYYVPIAPRLKQMFEVKSFATKLKVKQTGLTRFITDLHQSKAWGEFSSNIQDDRTVALSYCSDGLNPFHHHITQGSYSVWGMTGAILNLPPEMRHKVSNLLLYGLICGPKTPSKLTVCSKVIADELLQLRSGIEAFDASTNTPFVMRAILDLMVFDVPGMAKEQNRVQHGSLHSCSYCTIDGEHSKVLDKVVYLGSRRFLPYDHPLRDDITFPSGQPEHSAIFPRSIQKEKQQGKAMAFLVEKSKEIKFLKTLPMLSAKDTGRYGDCPWFKLDLDMQQKHAPVEPMHCLKVVAEHILKLLNGDEDGPKVRAEEKQRSRFHQSCPDEVFKSYVTDKKGPSRKRKHTGSQNDQEKEVNSVSSFPKNQLPPAPFTLTKDQKVEADKRLNQIKVPVGFGDIPTTLFTGLKGGTKSHTWLQLFTQGVVRFCLKGFLGPHQHSTLMRLLVMLEELFAGSVDAQKIEHLKREWHVVLSLFERDFPVSVQGYVVHLLHHLPDYIQIYGPVHNFWMYLYERGNKEIAQSISNNRYPELSAIKHYKIKWLITILDEAEIISLPESEDDDVPECATTKYLCGYSRKRPMSKEELHAYRRYSNTELEDKCITQFSHAKVLFNHLAKSVDFRCEQFENKLTNNICSSVIFVNIPMSKLVGRIQHFLLINSQEFAFIKWYGVAKLFAKNFTYFVDTSKPPTVPEHAVVPVLKLSAPLVHAWEGQTLWLPKFN